MFLVLFVLHDPNKLPDLLRAWEEVGVRGATILPSTGLARLRQSLALRDDLPIMPSLRDFYHFDEGTNRTLFTVLEDEALIEPLREATERVVGPLDQPETGLLVVLPALRVYGLGGR